MNYHRTIRALTAILSLHLLAPLATLGALFDDFNDNSNDPAKWNADRVSGPVSISLPEQNSRLEMISTSTDFNQSYVFQDGLMNVHYSDTWQVTVDAYNLVDINTEPSARVGLAVFSPSLTHVSGIFLKADDGGRRLQGYDGSGFGPDFWTRPTSELADNGNLIIYYSPSTHLLSFAFANGIGVESPVTFGTLGIDGAAVGSLGTENWGMTGSDLFTVSLAGTTAGTPVATGKAWFDNVQLVRQTPGDFNSDGKFDAADYPIWRKTGDTLANYNTWRSHFGQTTGAGTTLTSTALSSNVPEPTTLALITLAATTIHLLRRRQAQQVRRRSAG